jgi:CBS domain-containing protein
MNRRLKELFQTRNNVVYHVTGDTTIKDAVDLMNLHNIGSLIVMSKQGEIEGIFTERDVMKKLASTNELVGHLPVREIMVPREKLISITGEETMAEVMELMVSKKVKHLPVVEEGALHGIIAIGDVVSILLRNARKESEDMQNFVSGKYPS